MDYHLAQNGRDVGVFPLEELRRRREAGELNGAELVWCAGMSNWQPLDSVLHQHTPSGPSAAPPPVTTRRSSRILIWIAVAAVAVVVAGLAFVGIAVMKFAERFHEAATETSSDRSVDVSSKPVTWTTNSLTEKILQERRKQFRIRQWVDGYEKRGQRDEPCDAEAVQYLETWIARNFGGDASTNLPLTWKWSDTLAAEPGCDDPLILTATGINCNEWHEQALRLNRALTGFEHSRHLAYPKFCATVYLAANLRKMEQNPNRVVALDTTAVKLLKEAFTDGSLVPEDQREIADMLVLNWGDGFLWRKGAAVCSVVHDQGKPYEWLWLTLEGEYHINEAWKARGNGYANTVTEEGWKGFHEHLTEARKYLTKAWQLRPDLPLASTRMMTVALGDSDAAEMRVWFDRAIAAQVDEPQAWKSMRWGLRPRWHGSLEAMLQLGITAVNTHRFDTDVPRKLIDVVTDMEEDLETPPGTRIFGREDIWPHIQEMYEGYIAEPSEAKSRDGWRGCYAAAAYLAGKYDVARTQLEALNWQPAAWSLSGWGVDLSLMPQEVAARTGPAGQQVAEAESSYNSGDVPEALRLYTDLASATNLDERTKGFVQDRIASLETEKRLQEGEWVDFLPSEDNDPHWVLMCGKYQRLADGSVEVQSGPEGHTLFPRVRIGPEFEVKGEFEVVRSSTKSFQAGLLMGMPHSQNGWYSFRMKRNDAEGQLVSFAVGWTAQQVAQPVPLNDTHNTFDFRLRHGRATASLNGEEVLHDAKPPREIHVANRGYLVALGAFNDTNDTVIRYRNVQIRRLIPETKKSAPF